MSKSTKTYHYTYIIRHINGRYYVGRRTYTGKDPYKDKYMGSGKWVRSIKLKSTLTKNIIAFYTTIEELKLAEFELIKKYFDDKYCMNMLCSSCGFSSEDVSGNKNPMYGRSNELSPHFGKRGKLNHNYGSKHTEETKKLISDNNARLSGVRHPHYGKTGELSYNYGKTGELNNRFGIPHTEKSKKLMSNKQFGENNPRATITEATVRLILTKIAEGGKDRPISEEFNTTVNVISLIRHKRTWKHVTI